MRTAMAREHPVLALGYGPVLASARFTVRKLLELTQLFAAVAGDRGVRS